MSTLQTQGTTIAIETSDSPSTFGTIGEVKSISGPSGSAPEIDTTNLSSTAREFNMGLPDEGNISISCSYDPDDTNQALCRTKRNSQVSGNFKITCADSPATTITFTAYVTEWSLSFDIDAVATLTIGLRLTGAVTIA
jgi:hypothetical protein